MNVFCCVLVIAIEWSGALVIDKSTIVTYGLRESNDAGAASTGAATKDTASNHMTSTVSSNDTTAERRWLMDALGDLLYRPASTPAHEILTASVTRQTTHEIVTANPSRPSWDSMDQGAMLRLLDSIAVTAIHEVDATRRKEKRQDKTTQYPYNAEYGYEQYWAGNRPPEAGKTAGDDDVSIAANNSSSVEGIEKSTKTPKEPMCGDNLECSEARKEYGPVCARSSVHEKRTFKDVCAMEAEMQCGNEEWVIVYRGPCEFGLWVQPTWRPHFKLHVNQIMQKTLLPYMKEWTTITHSSLLPLGRLGKTYGYDVKPAPG